MVRTIFVFLLVAIPAYAASLQITPGAYSSGKAYLNCVIDGARERCFLDTGSAMTLVASSKRYAGYTNLGAFQFKSAADIAQSIDTIRLHSVQIDDVAFHDVKVGRANFRGAETTLGIDILGRQPLAIKFKSKSALELNAPRPDAPLTTLNVSRHGVFSIPIDISGDAMHALWDTGVSLTSVDQAFITAHSENFKALNRYGKGLDGAGKPMLLRVFRARKITIADRTFKDVHVVAADLTMLREVDKDIQAVVGMNLIRKGNWFFDLKRRLWSFDR